MRALVDILKDYESMVAAYGQDPDDEEVQADLAVHRAELLEVLQLARRWEETDWLLHPKLLDGTVTSVPDGTGHSI
jgi:hypothetical protein